MESTPGEDADKTAEMTTNSLEYYAILTDKAVAGFKRTDSNFEKSSIMGKMISNSTVCYRKFIHE